MLKIYNNYRSFEMCLYFRQPVLQKLQQTKVQNIVVIEIAILKNEKSLQLTPEINEIHIVIQTVEHTLHNNTEILNFKAEVKTNKK